MVELILGNRREIDKEEREDIAAADYIEKVQREGGNWLELIDKYMEEGLSLDEIPIDDKFVDFVAQQEEV